MYHQIKFGCKNISSSANMEAAVIFNQMSPHCDPELEDSKPIFLHDTLAHDVASLYQVWLQTVQQLRRYHPHENSLEFLTFPVTLTLITIQQSFFFFYMTIQLMMMCNQTKSSCKRISNSENRLESHTLIT